MRPALMGRRARWVAWPEVFAAVARVRACGGSLPVAELARELGFSSQGRGGTEEQWMKPSGGTMFGMSRTVTDGRTVFDEFLQIRTQDGGLVLIVQHSRNPRGVTFTATRVSDTEVVFENPDHDFPQRIVYRKQPDGSLFARIDGKEKGKEKAVDFPMTRARCE